jgi:hypothetical protein
VDHRGVPVESAGRGLVAREFHGAQGALALLALAHGGSEGVEGKGAQQLEGAFV